MWGAGRVYRLEVSVDDPQVVHAAQGLGYTHQLLARRVRGTHDNKGGDRHGHQLKPVCIGLVPQVPSKIEAFHILVDETEGVCLGRVHPYECYYVHTSVMKEGPYVKLIVEPLQGTISSVLDGGSGCGVPQLPE